MNITTGTSSKTLIVEVTDCFHSDTDPLYAGPNYEQLVGMVCADCHRQFFYTETPEEGRRDG